MQISQTEKRYHTDHSIIYSCQYHAIWCPKYRRKVLVDSIDERFEELVLEKQIGYGYEILAMEVMPDHVHLIIDCDPRVGIDTVIGKTKGFTSHHLRMEFPVLKSRLPTLWTRSKIISTVGSVTLAVVKQYIEEQKNV